jgi:hypothetical protein
MAEEFIIDCAGKKVPVGDKLYSAKCWKGNSNDFLQGHRDFIIPEVSRWWPVPVSIVVPIYRAGEGYAATLQSLYDQEWSSPQNVEIILYINEPPGPEADFTRKSLALAKSLLSGDAVPTEYRELARDVAAPETPELKLINEQFEGGLATLYRRSFATLVARLFHAVEARELESKDEEVSALEKLYKNTFFTVVDDDLVFPDTKSFPNAIDALHAGNSVLLGRTRISAVSSGYPELNEVLLNVMNLFFEFKYAQEAIILPPRAAAVSDLFHEKPPLPEVDYADQIWFAGGAQGKERLYVPVLTTLEDEEYPSNAQMSKALGDFLKTGEPEDAVSIFENVRKAYDSACAGDASAFSLSDVDELIKRLKGRNLEEIFAFSTNLLNKGK